MNITANQRLTTFLSFLGAIFVVGLLCYNFGTDETRLADRWLTECETENAESHSEDVVAILLSEGWYSIAGDGAERIYSPGCKDY